MNIKAPFQTRDEDSAQNGEMSTCSGRSSDSVDVDLGKSGGVVVNDDLDRRNIQTSVAWRDDKCLILDKGREGEEHFHSTLAARSCSPGCHVCRDQDFVDTGLELGEVGKPLFLGKLDRSVLFPLTGSSGLIRLNPPNG